MVVNQKNKPKLKKKFLENKNFNIIKDENKSGFWEWIKTKSNGFIKDMIISAYDQRKLPFIKKLQNSFFSIYNIGNIVYKIIKSYKNGKTANEITKEIINEFQYLKIFTSAFLCHITTSPMEYLVDIFLKTNFGKDVACTLLDVCFPPAPALLFVCDIIISWLGGKIYDLIKYLYNEYLHQYVKKTFDYVKEKVKKGWKWFTSFF